MESFACGIGNLIGFQLILGFIFGIYLAPLIIAVVRMPTAEEAAVVCAGLSRVPALGIEVTMTTPGALELIRGLSWAGVAVGAGTVTTPGQVEEVATAGARFVVAPNTDPAVIEQAHRHRLPPVPSACARAGRSGLAGRARPGAALV